MTHGRSVESNIVRELNTDHWRHQPWDCTYESKPPFASGFSGTRLGLGRKQIAASIRGRKIRGAVFHRWCTGMALCEYGIDAI